MQDEKIVTLQKVREKIAKPENYTAYGMARNRFGRFTSFRSKNAVRFRLEGAFYRTKVGTTSLYLSQTKAWNHGLKEIVVAARQCGTPIYQPMSHHAALVVMNTAIGMVVKKKVQDIAYGARFGMEKHVQETFNTHVPHRYLSDGGAESYLDNLPGIKQMTETMAEVLYEQMMYDIRRGRKVE